LKVFPDLEAFAGKGESTLKKRWTNKKPDFQNSASAFRPNFFIARIPHAAFDLELLELQTAPGDGFSRGKNIGSKKNLQSARCNA